MPRGIRRQGLSLSMNVLVVTEYFYPRVGGGEIVVWRVASALAERGHNVRVVTARIEDTVEHEAADGLEVFRPFVSWPGAEEQGEYSVSATVSRLIFTVRLARYLRRLVSESRPDIIYNANYLPTLAVTLANLRNVCPVVMGIGSQYGRNLFRAFGPLLGGIMYMAARLILRFGKHDAIRCASREVASKLEKHSGKRVFVIPTPLESREIAAVKETVDAGAIRRSLGVETGTKLLSFVGRLDKIKNVDGLLRALAKLDADFKFVIVGDGPERSRLEKIIADGPELRKRVLLVGRRPHDEALAIMKASDVLILPSLSEVFPNVVLEALAVETPVIATEVGAVREIDSPNLYKIQDLAEIAGLLAEGVEYRPGDHTTDRYSLDKVILDYEAMFNEAVRNKAATAGRPVPVDRYE